MTRTKRIGIVGAGLIGSKRAASLGEHRLVAVADIDLSRAERLAQPAGARAYSEWPALVNDNEVDVIIVATTPDAMVPIVQAAMIAGKHVLVDKPAARAVNELAPIVAMPERGNVRVRVGFNHRFHPALLKAKQLVNEGVLGELFYIRARYGHGGRLGYEKEWRANPGISGGGELLDQGTHLIDLSRWFLGELAHSEGFIHTYFWDMPVEDNAFMLLRTASNQAAWLHVSWSEWKNLFCFEIFGRHGKLQIDGLGGSYGVETLTLFQMQPEMGPPEVQRFEFAGPDLSWQREMEEFMADIDAQRECDPGLKDALAALAIVAQISAHSRALSQSNLQSPNKVAGINR